MAAGTRDARRLFWLGFTAAALIVVGTSVATAALADAEAQWQQLSAQVVEAYRAGDYAKGMAAAEQVLQLARRALGPRHPYTLGSETNMVVLLVNQERRPETIRLLQEMEANLLGRIGQELYTTEAGTVRRQLVSSQAPFQDKVLTLATTASCLPSKRRVSTSAASWWYCPPVIPPMATSTIPALRDPRVWAP